MPIFNRYLLKNYLSVLFLSIFSFIAILLVSRLEEIARFAAMGAKLKYLALFTLYQIPYILPIAIPISCLISSMILFQRLSHTHELTALRSCGISIKRIISPLLCAGFFFSLGTFYISSEMATYSHLATRKMMHNISSVNPLLLLQSAKIARLQDAFIQMDPLRNGESAKNLVIALNNASAERLNLCFVKYIELQERKLQAHHVSLISSSPSKTSFDHLIIENQKFMSSSAPEFAKFLRKSGWKIANDHLKFKLLCIRIKMLKEKTFQDDFLNRHLKKCYSEIVRRFSIGMACFTFTLLGVSFGMNIGRSQNKKGLFSVLILAASFLIAFCMGKACDHIFWLSSLLFLFPHICIILVSYRILKRIDSGIE